MNKLHKIWISSKIALIIFCLSLAPQHAFGGRVDDEEKHEDHDNDGDDDKFRQQALIGGVTLGAIYIVVSAICPRNDVVKNDDNYFHVLDDEGVITCRPNRTSTDGAYFCRPNATASEVLAKFYENEDIESILRKYNQDIREHFLRCNFMAGNEEMACNINTKMNDGKKDIFPEWATKRCNRTKIDTEKKYGKKDMFPKWATKRCNRTNFNSGR